MVVVRDAVRAVNGNVHLVGAFDEAQALDDELDLASPENSCGSAPSISVLVP